MTDYLWKDIRDKEKLHRIIENYAHVVEQEDPETKKKSVKQICRATINWMPSKKCSRMCTGARRGAEILFSTARAAARAILLLGCAPFCRPLRYADTRRSIRYVVTDRLIWISNPGHILQFMQVGNTVLGRNTPDLRTAITGGQAHYRHHHRKVPVHPAVWARSIRETILPSYRRGAQGQAAEPPPR
jgi:type I restriction enzyme R subunit